MNSTRKLFGLLAAAAAIAGAAIYGAVRRSPR
jgi:hypothetical protein